MCTFKNWMNFAQEELVVKIIRHILENTSESSIYKAIEYSSIVFQANLLKSQDKNYEFYIKKWSKILNTEQIQQMKDLQIALPSKPHPIFKLLDNLKKTAKKSISKPKNTDNNRYRVSISENELLNELLTLLQCGTGDFIVYSDQKFQIQENISVQFLKSTQKILSTVQCLHELKNSKLVGIIGQTITLHISKEVKSFVNYVSQFNSENSSILQLQSYLLAKETERIHAIAFIYISIINSGSNYMATLAPLKSHGNPLVASIAQELISSCYSVILNFIQSWVIHGIIDDPFNEFFIKEDKSPNAQYKDPSEWWSTRYTFDIDKIPPKFFDKETLMKILGCGKALNFIKTFKTYNYDEGYVPFKGKCFDLSMLDSCLSTSMKIVIDLIVNQNWLIGHLKVINDFLLFCRGDFATSLFYAVDGADADESVHILTRALKGIDFGKTYFNKKTDENLLNYLDYKKKDSTALASLVYKIRDPITTVIGHRAMKLYERFSKFVWRIRSIQLTLSVGWKYQRIPLFVEEDYIGGIGETITGADLISKIAAMRFNFIFASASLNEWISTDVILPNRKEMEQQIQNSTSFDQIIYYHKRYLHQLKKGFLLTEEFAQAQTALAQLIDVFDQFISTVKDIYAYFNDCDAHYQYILNGGEDDFEDSPDIEFDEFNQNLDTIQQTFNTKLKVLHAKVSQNLGIPEFSHLELRLLSCTKSGEKE